MAEELSRRNWTADQIKALDEADAIMNRAFDEARAELVPRGLIDDLEFARCLRCSCEFFLLQNPEGLVPGSEAPPLACMRLGCRHLVTSHNIF